MSFQINSINFSRDGFDPSLEEARFKHELDTWIFFFLLTFKSRTLEWMGNNQAQQLGWGFFFLLDSSVQNGGQGNENFEAFKSPGNVGENFRCAIEFQNSDFGWRHLFFFRFVSQSSIVKKKLLKRLGLCLKRKQSSLGNNAEIVGSDALAFSSGLPVTVIDICCFLLFVCFFFLVTYLVNFRYLSGCGQWALLLLDGCEPEIGSWLPLQFCGGVVSFHHLGDYFFRPGEWTGV